MSTTDQDVRMFEYLATRIRTETHGCTPWDGLGQHQVFAEVLKGMHFATALEIVVRHAGDTEAKTPGAIKRTFLPAATSETRRRGDLPPKSDEECEKHMGELKRPFCKICAVGEVPAYHDTAEIPADVPKPGTPEYRALALNHQGDPDA